MNASARPGLAARARIALAWALLLAATVAAVPAPALAGQRLEREEREQLRQELRRQSREDRGQGWHGPERGRSAQRGGEDWEQRRNWEQRRAWERQERPMGYEHYRMPPEEREQLRRMLRERQQGRRD